MKKIQNKGFTLIELMVSLSIFALVMTVSVGSILGVFSANRQSRSLKTVMTNLNLAMESMSKEMRYGTNYHCGTAGQTTDPRDCASGDTQISFLSSDGVELTYRLNGTALEKQEDNGDFLPVTAPEVLLDQLTFYVVGSGTGDGLQPKTLIQLKGHAGTGTGRSDFTIETLVSQRAIEN